VTVDTRAARTAGLLYLLTFVASIAALPLLSPVLQDPRFVLTQQPSAGVVAGCLLDLVNAAACVGTAVVLYPLLRGRSPSAALGFVTSRVLEAAIIATGVICLLAVVTLQHSDSDDIARVALAEGLVAVRNWTFLLGPGLMPAVNALLLGTALLHSALVPRGIPLLGLIGAPLQLISVIGTLFGLNDQVSVWSAIAVLPIFMWELALGLWLTFRGPAGHTRWPRSARDASVSPLTKR
jgi:hypothetical protein